MSDRCLVKMRLAAFVFTLFFSVEFFSIALTLIVWVILSLLLVNYCLVVKF